MRIPTPVQRGQQVGSVTVDPLQPVFQNTQFANNQELAQNLGSLGTSLGNTASILDKRRADLDTRAAQAQIDLAVRQINDPQNGILSRRGSAAKGSADEIDSIMSGVRGNLNLGGLQGSSRQAVETLLKSTTESLYNRVAQFELGQLDVYDRELSEARVAGAADTAAADPLNNDAYQTGYLQAHDAGVLMAEQKGAKQGDALYDQTVKKQTSIVVLSRVDALANTSAKGAKDFLEAAYEAGHIDATSYSATKATLQPRIIEENATGIATQALAIRNGDSLIDPASPIMKLINQRESGSGGYRALYDQGQTSRFSNVDITKMTVRQLQDFSDPSGSYGQWVKPRLDPDGYAAQNGLTSTPMGKYQIVGGTLDSLVEEMGLTGDEVFDEALQDKMFATLMQRRLSKSDTAAGKRTQMRFEWEGFRKVDDATLDAAIAAFESGDGGNYGTPEDRIAAEPDMETRQLAQRLFNAEASSARASEERERTAAVDGFYATLDSMSAADLASTSWDQMLSQTERDILGSDVTGLRNWYLAKKGGEKIETDFAVVNDMMDNAAGINGKTAQMDFMNMNLNTQRAVLSDQTYNDLRETQRVMQAADQDDDLPDITDATPTMSQVSSMVDSKLQETGFKPNDADSQVYGTRLSRQVMSSLQQKALKMKGFKGWTDLDILNEIELQSVRITVDDGFGGLKDQTNIPLFQIGIDLKNENATADDLINAARDGTVTVGEYVLSAAGMADAKEKYLRENPAFEDVYADDLIEYVYGQLRQNPAALMGVTSLADQVEADALADGVARADAAGRAAQAAATNSAAAKAADAAAAEEAAAAEAAATADKPADPAQDPAPGASVRRRTAPKTEAQLQAEADQRQIDEARGARVTGGTTGNSGY